jgi:hypothetical protein
MGRAKVRLVNPQAIGSGATNNTTVEFDSPQYDDLGFWDQPNFELKIPPGMAGLYEILVMGTFEANSTGFRKLYINTNVAPVAGTSYITTVGSAWKMSASIQIGLLPGQTVHATVAQNSGGDLDLLGDELGSSSDITHMSIARIHPLNESQLA